MGLLRKILPFLVQYRTRLLTAVVGIAAITALSLLPPLILRYLLNDIVTAGNWAALVPAILAFVLVPVLNAGVSFGNSQLVMGTGYRFISSIRLAIYRNVLHLPVSFHQDTSSGLVVNRMMDDVNKLMQLITGTTVTLFTDIIVFLFSVGIVFSLSRVLFVVLLVIIALYVIAYRHFASRIRSQSTSYRLLTDRISERLQETIAGTRHVRIYNREPWENTMFLERTDRSLGHALSSNVNSVALSTVCNLIAGFGSAAVASLAALYVLHGTMQYGDLVAINSYLWMALNPALRLTMVANQLTETFVSARRVFEILEEENPIKDPPNAPEMPRGRGRVQFKDLVFSYTREIPLFNRLNLTVEPGQTVALVGHTGCGKTTLTNLLMRHWDIRGGQILIDGVDIRSVSLESLRSLFGVVLQDPIVFDATLAENIAYGRRDATRSQIEEAARAAEVLDLAERLPNGFDTYIGTRGVKLSLGEKQRISIARAIITDPVILIMDEATSSLDSESERLIQKALARVLKGRTSFVVAHRLSTITNADMIVVMDKGKIIERGRHEELMSVPDGTYRGLYEEMRKSVDREAVVE